MGTSDHSVPTIGLWSSLSSLVFFCCPLHPHCYQVLLHLSVKGLWHPFLCSLSTHRLFQLLSVPVTVREPLRNAHLLLAFPCFTAPTCKVRCHLLRWADQPAQHNLVSASLLALVLWSNLSLPTFSYTVLIHTTSQALVPGQLLCIHWSPAHLRALPWPLQANLPPPRFPWHFTQSPDKTHATRLCSLFTRQSRPTPSRTAAVSPHLQVSRACWTCKLQAQGWGPRLWNQWRQPTAAHLAKGSWTSPGASNSSQRVEPTTQLCANMLPTVTADHILQRFRLPSQNIGLIAVYESPACIPLTREGTNIDSFNYHPGVQRQKGQWKAERVLCPRRCPQYIPGNRTWLVPTPKPPRRGATTERKRPKSQPQDQGAPDPVRPTNRWTSVEGDDPFVITQLLKNSLGEGSKGQSNWSQMREKLDHFWNAIHSNRLMITGTDDLCREGQQSYWPLISIRGSTEIFLQFVQAIMLRKGFTHPMTSIFIALGPELAISLLMAWDSRRIITMVTFQNGCQSYQAPVHTVWIV